VYASVTDIADAVESGLAAHARELDAEQAVRGIDALDERALHPIIEQSLRAAGYGVAREMRYPADRAHRRASEGERCDFVLTPDARPLLVEAQRSTLFDPPDAVDPEDAFWLEAKVVAQFTEEGANRNYASQLLAPVRQDVAKLSKDRGILHAGLLLVLFTRDEIVANHDLAIWEDRCLRKGLPIAAPSCRTVPITNRLGHEIFTLRLYPVRHS